MGSVKLYIRDLLLRTEVAMAAEKAGFSTEEGDPSLVVVDLADDGSFQEFVEDLGRAGRKDVPRTPAIGFFPHVRKELAEHAWEHGIEPFEKRVFFADVPALLRRFLGGDTRRSPP